MKSRLFLRIIALAGFALLGTGCTWLYNLFTPTEAPPVIQPTSIRHPTVSEGSLWAGRDNWSLFADDKAAGAGDLVLVKIVEDSKASRTSKSQMKKNSSMDSGITNFFGQESQLTKALSTSGGTPSLEHLIKEDSKSSFDSDANVEQAGSVVGNVMAEVVEQRPNGCLRIFGSQVVTINNDDVVVTLSGVIRPSDIARDNTILSSQVADARILYSSRGPAVMATRPGWFFRLYYSLWPF